MPNTESALNTVTAIVFYIHHSSLYSRPLTGCYIAGKYLNAFKTICFIFYSPYNFKNRYISILLQNKVLYQPSTTQYKTRKEKQNIPKTK